MEYNKVTCFLDPDNELTRELLIAALGEVGFESFVENDEAVEAYIPNKNFRPEMLLSDMLQNPEYFKFSYSTEVLPDENWNEVWEKNYFEPLQIENSCTIRAPFHEAWPSSPFEIVINPRMAFGTGNHETTWLMIKIMLSLDIQEKKVLDMGCGSGILAIFAAMKGAQSVTAIDIDEWSYNNALENAELNQVAHIQVMLGDAALLPGMNFDLILANIQRNILLEDMHAYRSSLPEGGTLVMSGFYLKDLQAIEEKAISLGLKPAGYWERSDWCAARFTC